jgi:predicted NBD/HSP70 family sugar kinase
MARVVRASDALADLGAVRGRGAGSEQLRRHNLSTILTLLHHGGSQPRSALTATTGLNRSTVAALVIELAERGLAHESEPDPTNQVGRPSPTVNADPRNVAIAVNPEIDAVTVGVVSFGGQVLKRIRFDTDRPPTAREAVNITVAILEGLKGEFERDGWITGVGVALPGMVRADDGLVRLAPHLEWVDEPFAAMLAAATGYPARVGNDANLGAIAEHIFGAGRGIGEMVYLNGGPSGIGGGVIANGAILPGAAGYAGEFGHTAVLAGQRDATDVSLEQLVNRAELLAVLGLGHATPDALEEALLASTAGEVDEVVHRQLAYLGRALANSINVLNPRRIVLGGFLGALLAKAPEYLHDQVQQHALGASFDGVELVRAQLGSDLLMIGAAELIFADLLADPSAVRASVIGTPA